MAKTSTIMRSSMHYFFCNYHTFASLAAMLIFPASAVTLLSKTLIPSSATPSSSFSSSFFLAVSYRLRSLFEAANFPSSSRLFVVLTDKLSQAIVSFPITLPFTLTFFTLSKACIIFTARKFPLHRHALPSILHLYLHLLLTHLFTGFIILSANAAAFLMSLIAFSAVGTLGLASRTLLLMLSGAGAIIYSIIFANVLVTCNLASIVSAMENCNGYTAVLKACLLIRGKASVALSLSLCTNLVMAAAEALFQMKVMRPFLDLQTFNVSLLCEAFVIAYMHSIISVIDIIISCCFYKSCKAEMNARYEGQFVGDRELEPEEKGDLRV